MADDFAGYAGAAAALFIAGVGALLRLMSVALKKQMDALKLELSERVGVETDSATSKFGEAVSAVREKITQVELWNRDNFVNVRTFEAIVADIRRLEDKIDRRFDAVDRKLTKMDNGQT